MVGYSSFGRRSVGRRVAAAVAAVLLLPPPTSAVQSAPRAGRVEAGSAVTLRPSALAALIGQVAGRRVTVPGARIVWVIDTRAMLVESDTRLDAAPGHRNRVLVLLATGTLALPRPPLSVSPVTIDGVARTLLGIQADTAAGWPEALTRDLVDRLEVRAAILASSVRTAEGVELTASREPQG